MKKIVGFVSVASITWLLLLSGSTAGEKGTSSTPSATSELVFVKGGTFNMGDVFGDGNENEKPVHAVNLDSYYMGKCEVTVAQFRAFVEATGYRTSAEHPENPDGFTRGWGDQRPETEADRYRLHGEVLAKSDGAAVWNVEKNRWVPYLAATNWREPRITQTDTHPVVAVSWDDAASYCNWLSKQEGLPSAYDVSTGQLLDKSGKPTSDVTAVPGYRLSTEAEWEYAAREGGRDVRFGNGKNVARSEEIVFRADAGDYPYLEKGTNRKTTLPVGSLPPNALGLHDMSGNAWEWTSDDFVKYDSAAQKNPYSRATEGQVRLQTLRGGRWGGNASEARVFSRDPFLRNDRCNNSGFRIARSK